MFRGKSLESGLWVYGYVIFSKPFVDGKRSAWIIEESILPLGAVSTPTSKFIQVDPETVGQFTGLQDKNGRDIYEGDICKLSINPNSDIYMGRIGVSNFTSVARVEYEPGVYLFINLTQGKGKQAWVRKPIGRHEIESAEVIGNIHENGDLLN